MVTIRLRFERLLNVSVQLGDLVYFSQIFEGLDLLHIKKGNAQARALTVSFWVNTTKTGTYIVSMYDNDNARSCSQAYTVSSSDTWEYKTVTFPPDTTGAYDNDNAENDAEAEAYSDTEVVVDLEAAPTEEIVTLNYLPDFLYLDTQI